MPTCGALVQQVLVAMSAPFLVQFMFKLLHGMGCISIPVFACDESGAVRGHARGHTGGHLWSRGIARPLDFQESLDPFSLDARPHRFSCNPMDCSPLSFSVHGISQARHIYTK